MVYARLTTCNVEQIGQTQKDGSIWSQVSNLQHACHRLAIACKALAHQRPLLPINHWPLWIVSLAASFIAGATQEALVEQYTDQLRDIRQAGIAEEAEEVREVLRALRDEDRAPESTVKVSTPWLLGSSTIFCSPLSHQAHCLLKYNCRGMSSFVPFLPA